MNIKPHLDIGQAQDLAMFKRRLLDFASDLGFGLASAALIFERPDHSCEWHSISNVPPAFADASVDPTSTKRDPVQQRLKRAHVPFVYDQRFYIDNAAADLWEEQAPFGYRNGISICMHLSHGRHFTLGVDRPEPLPTNEEAVTQMMAAIQIVAAHALEAATRVWGLENATGFVPRLTDREREVLQWTVAGKSAWVAGEIMSLSERAVNFHLRNACAKLDSCSKHQAALKALQMGLL